MEGVRRRRKPRRTRTPQAGRTGPAPAPYTASRDAFSPCRDSSSPVSSSMAVTRTGVHLLINQSIAYVKPKAHAEESTTAAHCFQKKAGLPEKSPLVLDGLKARVANMPFIMMTRGPP